MQVWLPPVPHICAAPGAQAPWFMQAPQSDQAPLLHVRLWVPQLPQAWVGAPVQVWFPQPPHWQAAVQVCMPPVPHICMAPGAQEPSLAQPDQADQTPLSQVRDWLPQLPQLCMAGPVQL